MEYGILDAWPEAWTPEFVPLRPGVSNELLLEDILCPLEEVARLRRCATNVGNPGCWLWTAARSAKGYPHAQVRGLGLTVFTRVIYAISSGCSIPAGMFVAHHCDTPPCVNPNHLFLTNVTGNTRDMIRKGRRASCVGTLNGHARFDEEMPRMVRRLHAEGYEYRRIAEIVGTNLSHVARIIKGSAWRSAL